jgi:hypothetical protein
MHCNDVTYKYNNLTQGVATHRIDHVSQIDNGEVLAVKAFDTVLINYLDNKRTVKNYKVELSNINIGGNHTVCYGVVDAGNS